MKPQNFVGLVGACAAILVWSAPLAVARGGGGFSGGHAGSSSAGGRTSGGSAAAREGMRGYNPAMRGYPGYSRAAMRGYSSVYRPGAVRVTTGRPSTMAGRSAVHATNSARRTSVAAHRSSTSHAVNSEKTGVRTGARKSQALDANTINNNGLNRGRTGDLTTLPRQNAARSKGRSGQFARFDPANSKRFDSQTQQRLRNWEGRRSSFGEARQRHNDWCHGHHGHDWWHHHCDVFIIWDWGFWGWYGGWWYPAWGYDPYYSSYEYDGPVYGYDGLPPDEAIANVQTELQRRGYYNYEIDGKLGPLTQNALNRYQRDHRLPITGTIDPATVSSLGVGGGDAAGGRY